MRFKYVICFFLSSFFYFEGGVIWRTKIKYSWISCKLFNSFVLIVKIVLQKYLCLKYKSEYGTVAWFRILHLFMHLSFQNAIQNALIKILN